MLRMKVIFLKSRFKVPLHASLHTLLSMRQTECAPPPHRLLISGVTEVKGGRVLRDDRRTTGGARLAFLLGYTHQHALPALTQQGGSHSEVGG